MIIEALTISLWCLGFRTITDEGMILYPLRRWALRLSDDSDFWFYALKPLILCPPCTASLHGLIVGAAMFGMGWHLIPAIVGASFLNALGWNAIEALFKYNQ